MCKVATASNPATITHLSLTSLCCKVQEHIIVSNIPRHVEEHDILTDCQHGFRTRRSCETQMITLVRELAESLDNSRQVEMIILDFSKAFDWVPHQRLLKKLHHYGVRGQTYNWIRSFLTNRSQYVIVNGAPCRERCASRYSSRKLTVFDVHQ